MQKEIKCPRCLRWRTDIEIDQDGEPYICDECWDDDDPDNNA